jgi:hypothetical protein
VDGDLGCVVAASRIQGGGNRCLNIQAGVDHWNGVTATTGVRWVYRRSIRRGNSGVFFTHGGVLNRTSSPALSATPA